MTSEVAHKHPINRIDFFTGLIVIAIGAAAAYAATGYGIGTARRMGAGFFPVALGLIAMGLGTLIAARAVKGTGSGRGLRVDPRQFLFVTAAFVVFALGIDPLGAPLTVCLATVIACFGDRRATFTESSALGLGLAAAIWLIFVQMLGLALPVWPAILSTAP